MSSFDKDAARKLCDAASPGPWEYDDNALFIFAPNQRKDRDTDPFTPLQVRGWGHLQYMGHEEGAAIQNANGHFAAQARTLLPQALDRIEELEAKLTAAIETINGVQAHVGKFSKGSSTVSEACLAAWNLNAQFLSDNPNEQTAYLKSIGVLK